MRFTLLTLCFGLAAFGCSNSSSNTPDTAPESAVVDTPADTRTDAPADAPDASAPDASAPDVPADVDATVADASDDSFDVNTPCTRDVNAPDTSGPMYGYIRFANLSRGTGTLRFIATSLPMFAPARVEAVVPEGTATAHIQTLPVAYEVRVVRAAGADAGVDVEIGPADAGVLTDGAASPATACTADAGVGEVAPPICTDVYFFAGCTVVLAGSATGNVEQQRDRRLWRLSDTPENSNSCYYGRMRTMNWYAEGPALDVDTTRGERVARNAQYREISGAQPVLFGATSVAIRNAETGAALVTTAAGTVNPGHSHRLHLWGDANSTTNNGVSAIILDDVSPAFQ